MLDADALIRIQEEAHRRAGPKPGQFLAARIRHGPNARRTFLEPRRYCVLAASTNRAGRAIARPVVLTDTPPADLLEVWEPARHGSRAAWADAWFELRPERLLSYAATP